MGRQVILLCMANAFLPAGRIHHHLLPSWSWEQLWTMGMRGGFAGVPGAGALQLHLPPAT